MNKKEKQHVQYNEKIVSSRPKKDVRIQDAKSRELVAKIYKTFTKETKETSVFCEVDYDEFGKIIRPTVGVQGEEFVLEIARIGELKNQKKKWRSDYFSRRKTSHRKEGRTSFCVVENSIWRS